MILPRSNVSKRVALILFGIVAFASTAFASPEAVEQLRRETLRPTIAQIISACDGLNAPNPFRAPAQRDVRLNQITAVAPETIAALEAAYPGADWALLGRDSAYFADILEAYYIATGQPERVIRLNASSGSFVGGHERAFLESNGLVLGPNGLPKKPYIVIDATSWRGSLDQAESQSRKLLESVYRFTPQQFRPALADRLNVVGQGGASGGSITGAWITPAQDLEGYKNSLSLGQAGPSKIFYISPTFAYGEQAWHDKFGPFILLPDGEKSRVVAPAGTAMSAEMREGILWNAFEAAKLVMDPEFLKKVNKEMNRYGFDQKFLVEHPELYDDGKLETFRQSKEWRANEIVEWTQSIQRMPKVSRKRVNEIWLSLVEAGVGSGIITTGDFRALADGSSVWKNDEKRFLRELLERNGGIAANSFLRAFAKFLVAPANRTGFDGQAAVLALMQSHWNLVTREIFEATELKASDLIRQKDLSPVARVEALSLLPKGVLRLDDYLAAFDSKGSASSGAADTLKLTMDHAFKELNAGVDFYLALRKTALLSDTQATLWARAASSVRTLADLRKIPIEAATPGMSDEMFRAWDRVLESVSANERKSVVTWMVKFARDQKDDEFWHRLAEPRNLTGLTAGELSLFANLVFCPPSTRVSLRQRALRQAILARSKDEILGVLDYSQAVASTTESLEMNALVLQMKSHLVEFGATDKDVKWLREKVVIGKSAKEEFDQVYDPSNFVQKPVGVFLRAARWTKAGALRCATAVKK